MLSEWFQGIAAIAAIFVCVVWFNCMWLTTIYKTSETTAACFCGTFLAYGETLGVVSK